MRSMLRQSLVLQLFSLTRSLVWIAGDQWRCTSVYNGDKCCKIKFKDQFRLSYFDPPVEAYDAQPVYYSRRPDPRDRQALIINTHRFTTKCQDYRDVMIPPFYAAPESRQVRDTSIDVLMIWCPLKTIAELVPGELRYPRDGTFDTTKAKCTPIEVIKAQEEKKRQRKEEEERQRDEETQLTMTTSAGTSAEARTVKPKISVDLNEPPFEAPDESVLSLSLSSFTSQ